MAALFTALAHSFVGQYDDLLPVVHSHELTSQDPPTAEKNRLENNEVIIDRDEVNISVETENTIEIMIESVLESGMDFMEYFTNDRKVINCPSLKSQNPSNSSKGRLDSHDEYVQ